MTDSRANPEPLARLSTRPVARRYHVSADPEISVSDAADGQSFTAADDASETSELAAPAP